MLFSMVNNLIHIRNNRRENSRKYLVPSVGIIQTSISLHVTAGSRKFVTWGEIY